LFWCSDGFDLNWSIIHLYSWLCFICALKDRCKPWFVLLHDNHVAWIKLKQQFCLLLSARSLICCFVNWHFYMYIYMLSFFWWGCMQYCFCHLLCEHINLSNYLLSFSIPGIILARKLIIKLTKLLFSKNK
jgi:hypothetical protein